VPFKLFGRRLKRSLRYSQRHVEDLSVSTEQGLEQYVFRRIGHLASVRRFVISWVLLLVLLIGGLVGQNIMLSTYYQTVKAVPGGIYNEGILGTFSNGNPIFAASGVDVTVSKLLYAGLFTYDTNGKLVGDLAESYTADARGKVYTVKLKPSLTWHDGEALTSEDVLFTYQTIQNPDVQSPLQASWQGIQLSAPDAQTVVFTLPDPLSSFIYNLTTGIIPKHVLESVEPADFRTNDFNTLKPIGAGPFRMGGIQVDSNDPATSQQQLAFLPFEDYHAGKPKLQEFVVHAYADKQELIKAFEDRQLTSMQGLMEVPEELKDDSNVLENNLLLRAETMAFFKTSTGMLANQKVRAALTQASDPIAVAAKVGYPTKVARGPLLTGQVGFDPSVVQQQYNKKAAEELLAGDGWVKNKNGILEKGGQPLRFTITAADNAEYKAVTSELEKQWDAIGAEARVDLEDPTEFQTTLTSHTFDVLVYGISIGVDPDVFVYWHSSQADVRSAQRLNFSEYKNKKVDTALEEGRTRLDPTLRSVKYKPFLQAWREDAPAVALYQPRSLYITTGVVDGLPDTTLNSPTDRLNNVHNWQIRKAKVTNE
jgi:peptide/nickel transport system substrate-binding protein